MMTSVKCPICNLTNWSTDQVCKRCKRPLGTAGSAPSSSGPYPYSQASPKMGMAIASMVLGLIGCFILSPVGLILGIVSTKRANRSPAEYGGLGFGIAGIVLNALGVLTIPIILVIAIPNLLAARQMANEGSAIRSIRQLAAAENTYTTIIGECGDLTNLGTKGLVDPELANGQKSGYRFLVVTMGGPTPLCEIHATPISDPGPSRSFFISTDDNVLRAARKQGQHASKSDPPLDSNISQSRDHY